MSWQEFLKDISSKHGLSPEETETLLARLPKEDEDLKEDMVAGKIGFSIQTVKARMGKVYTKFEESCPELATRQGAGNCRRDQEQGNGAFCRDRCK